ncbi:MAG: transporter substrate-binding domain-containing protein [Bdellovibrio sp.]|nr:transporter substrate-binding domain-containing protein [Bdellovibrio sp.]
MAFLKLLSLFGVAFAAYFAFAAKEPRCERRYDVGLAAYAPLSFREDGRIKGVAHDITRELARRTGCTFSETEYSRITALKQIELGRIDLYLVVAIGDEFLKVGDFHHLYTSGRTLTVTQEVGNKHKTVDGYLKDKAIKFGRVIGSRPAMSVAEEDKLVKAQRTVTTTDPENLFRMLKDKRIQAVLYPTLSAGYFRKKMNLADETVQIVDEGAELDVGYISSKRRMSRSDVAMINNQIAEMKKDGTFLKILLKYVDKENAPKSL